MLVGSMAAVSLVLWVVWTFLGAFIGEFGAALARVLLGWTSRLFTRVFRLLPWRRQEAFPEALVIDEANSTVATSGEEPESVLVSPPDADPLLDAINRDPGAAIMESQRANQRRSLETRRLLNPTRPMTDVHRAMRGIIKDPTDPTREFRDTLRTMRDPTRPLSDVKRALRGITRDPAAEIRDTLRAMQDPMAGYRKSMRALRDPTAELRDALRRYGNDAAHEVCDPSDVTE